MIAAENGWHPSIEALLSEISSEAIVREKLHRTAHYKYKSMLNWFQLPLIAISACNASAQFLSKSYPDYENAIITATGSTSVFVSIITAVMSYLKVGQLSSTHSKAQSEWSTLYNTIRAQLMLARELRMNAVSYTHLTLPPPPYV